MATIKTKQGNELALETFNGAVYVRTPKGAFKIQSFEYMTGAVALLGTKGGFEVATTQDKQTIAAEIDLAAFSHKHLPELILLDESALDESLATLEGICNGLR